MKNAGFFLFNQLEPFSHSSFLLDKNVCSLYAQDEPSFCQEFAMFETFIINPIPLENTEE